MYVASRDDICESESKEYVDVVTQDDYLPNYDSDDHTDLDHLPEGVLVFECI